MENKPLDAERAVLTIPAKQRGDSPTIGELIDRDSEAIVQATSALQMDSSMYGDWGRQLTDSLSNLLEQPLKTGTETVAETLLQSASGRAIVQNLNGIVADISSAVPTIKLPAWGPDFSDILSSFVAELAPFFEIAKALDSSIASDEMIEAAEKWGDYGWSVHGGMAFNELRKPPMNMDEADALCIARFDEDALSELISAIGKRCSNPEDLNEAFELFNSGHYKPCAMLTCALIDGHLIRRDKPELSKEGKRRWRKGKHTVELLMRNLPEIAWRALRIKNYRCAYDHFFRGGTDFEPKLEGELNRNFLVHGMDSKKVTRTGCIKLFILLRSTLELV